MRFCRLRGPQSCSWEKNLPGFGELAECAEPVCPCAQSHVRRSQLRHPLEEAQGFRALLNLDEPKYSIEQIAAKTGKSPAYCLQRVKLTELAAAVTEAFAKDEIGIGHALLLAKLQPAEQEQALAGCFRSDWNGNQSKARRILLPVRHLKEWIEQNILLILKDAPFSKSDATLNPTAGSCDDCPKRTGANALLFADIAQDACKLCGIWATASLSCWRPVIAQTA